MKTHGKLFSNLIAAGFLLTAVFFLLRCFDIIHGMLLGWVIAPIWVAMLVLAVILLIGRAAKLGLALRLLPFEFTHPISGERMSFSALPPTEEYPWNEFDIK